MKKRNVIFAVFTAALVLVFLSYLRQLILFSFNHEHYSHMVLIPLVSLYLFWLNRSNIFSRVQYSARAGAGFLVAGIVVYLLAVNWGEQVNQNDYHFLMMSSFLILFLRRIRFLLWSFNRSSCIFSSLVLTLHDPHTQPTP